MAATFVEGVLYSATSTLTSTNLRALVSDATVYDIDETNLMSNRAFVETKSSAPTTNEGAAWWDSTRKQFKIYDETSSRWRFIGPDHIFNVMEYGAIGDGTIDDTIAVHAAIDACALVGGGIVFFPRGTYIVTSGKTIAISMWLVGEGTMAEFNGSNQTHTNISRIAYDGASPVTMFLFEASGGERMFNPAVKNIFFDGRPSSSPSKADKAVRFNNFTHATVENVQTERFQTCGIHLDGTSMVSTNARILYHKYNWGTNPPNPEDNSDGILIGSNSDMGSGAGVTNVTGMGVTAAVYDGAGIRFQGNVDGCNFFHSRASVQNDGHSVYFANNTGTEKSPRRNVFWWLSGNTHSESLCVGNRVFHGIAEGGAGAGGNDAHTFDAGGQIHYDVIDYTDNDVFETHKYRMSDELELGHETFSVTTGTPTADTTASYIGCTSLPAGANTGLGRSVLAKKHWNNGTITKVRVFYSALNADNTNTWQFRLTVTCKQPGSGFGTPDYQDTTSPVISTAGGDGELDYVDVTVDVAYERDDILALEIRRTTTGTAGAIRFHGMVVFYESSGPDSTPTKVFSIPPAYTD